jgi:hypothetical protein
MTEVICLLADRRAQCDLRALWIRTAQRWWYTDAQKRTLLSAEASSLNYKTGQNKRWCFDIVFSETTIEEK